MSVVIQIGQCGNQLGKEIFTKLASDIETASTNDYGIYSTLKTWFIENDKNTFIARSVLVDTEEKVFNQNDWNFQPKEGIQNWSYRRGYRFSQKNGGCANNWATGYHENGPSISVAVLESVRLILEKTDHAESIVPIFSSSGGTGSGIGSLLVEALRDEYENATIAPVMIFPYFAGEIALQDFNTIFTVSSIYESSDSLLALKNDEAHSICADTLHLRNFGLGDMNNILAEQVACLFQSGFNILNRLTPHPSFKILTSISEPYIAFKDFTSPLEWRTVLRRLRYSLQNKIKLSERKTIAYHKTIANLLLCRGPGAKENSSRLEDFLNLNYVNWVPPGEKLRTDLVNSKFLNKDKFALLVSNNLANYSDLNVFMERAWKCFANNVYIHHYLNHGMEKEAFIQHFTFIEGILSNLPTA